MLFSAQPPVTEGSRGFSLFASRAVSRVVHALNIRVFSYVSRAHLGLRQDPPRQSFKTLGKLFKSILTSFVFARATFTLAGFKESLKRAMALFLSRSQGIAPETSM